MLIHESCLTVLVPDFITNGKKETANLLITQEFITILQSL